MSIPQQIKYAAQGGKLAEVMKWFGSGVRDSDDATNLLLTMSREFSERENCGVLRYLLDKGARPDAANADGATLLHHAAEMGLAKAVRLLLDAGADPCARDR